jgi:hypothetical protein
VEERIADAALVDQKSGEPCAFRLDGAGESGGTGADYKKIHYV